MREHSSEELCGPHIAISPAMLWSSNTQDPYFQQFVPAENSENEKKPQLPPNPLALLADFRSQLAGIADGTWKTICTSTSTMHARKYACADSLCKRSQVQSWTVQWARLNSTKRSDKRRHRGAMARLDYLRLSAVNS